MRFGTMFFAAMMAAVVADAACASIIQTNTEVSGTCLGIATATNLITSGQSTLSGISANNFNAFNNGATNINYLNDNGLGAFPGDPTGLGTALDTGDAWTLTVSLNTTTNTKGYEITNIKTISGWTGAWVNQKYTAYYSTVADPTNWISLGTYSLTSALNGDDSQQTSLQISLTSDSGVIASNVAYLKFEFQLAPLSSSSTTDHGTAYRELEVFGTASVPEPSTTVLTFSAMASLLAYAWRKRRNAI